MRGSWRRDVDDDDDDDYGREDSRALSFILSVLCVFSPLYSEQQNDDDEESDVECMTNAHTHSLTHKYHLSLTLFLHLYHSVVAQSYKIDVEILAAPRGKLTKKFY